jgi:transposase
MGDCIGVDVSKHHLDWAVGGEGPVDRVANTLSSVRRLVGAIRKLNVDLIVVESAGGYERSLTVALSEANLAVVLVNPWRVRRFGEGLGILAKTDPLDARVLALFGEPAQPERRPIPGPRQPPDDGSRSTATAADRHDRRREESTRHRFGGDPPRHSIPGEGARAARREDRSAD